MSGSALIPIKPISPVEGVERALVMGDLAQLTPEQRLGYYKTVCESVGLNPATQPFEYITLNGKLRLYAKRDATEQLRKIHNVSVKIVKREVIDGVLVVEAEASMPSGRYDQSIGAVALGNLKGEMLANAWMKGETKAKRRVTLSICGLGFLDESEVGDIPGARPGEPEPKRNTKPTSSTSGQGGGVASAPAAPLADDKPSPTPEVLGAARRFGVLVEEAIRGDPGRVLHSDEFKVVHGELVRRLSEEAVQKHWSAAGKKPKALPTVGVLRACVCLCAAAVIAAQPPPAPPTREPGEDEDEAALIGGEEWKQ